MLGETDPEAFDVNECHELPWPLGNAPRREGRGAWIGYYFTEMCE
jgi:hypothetical protein